MITTLQGLREAHACTERYIHLRKALGTNYGDRTPVTMVQILDLNGLEDCIWALVNTQQADRLLRIFACDCTEHVLPIFEKAYPKDDRPRNAIAVARRFANGEAPNEERAAAWDVALDAAWAVALDADWAADRAAARDTSLDADWAAARDAEKQWQLNHMRELLEAE